jgi:hypothetical protein
VAEHLRAGAGHGLLHGGEWHSGLPGNANANGNCDSDIYANSDSDSYAHTDSYANGYAYTDTDSYSYVDTYSYGYSYSNVTVADGPAAAFTYAEAAWDTPASPVVRSGSDK